MTPPAATHLKIGGVTRAHAVRDGIGLSVAAAAWWFAISDGYAIDAYAYWSVDITRPYTLPSGEVGAFSYSPPAAQLFALAGSIPFPFFLALWTAFLVVVLLWLVPRRWWAPAVVLAFPELFIANVHLPIAAAMVLALQRTAAWWCAPILLKVIPGIGLGWHLFRREWRSLGIAIAVTVGIAAASYATAPALWAMWIDHLVHGPIADAEGPFVRVPLLWRLPAGLAIVLIAVAMARRSLLPVAVLVALPNLSWVAYTILLAIPRLHRMDTEDRRRMESSKSGISDAARSDEPDAEAMSRSVRGGAEENGP